jgi:hypothetical protein
MTLTRLTAATCVKKDTKRVAIQNFASSWEELYQMAATTKTVKYMEKGREKIQKKKYFSPKPSTVLLLRPEEEGLVKEFYESPWERVAASKELYSKGKGDEAV